MATNYLFLQSEVIRKGAMPVWQTKKFNVLLDFIKKGEEEKIGERDFRIPFKTKNGGRIGTYNPQMGDMGRGNAMAGAYMTGSYFNTRLNFELDMLTIKATQDSKIALAKPFKEAVASGYVEYQRYLDKMYHNDGTAVIAVGTAHAVASGKSVYTLDSNFGAMRLVRGQYVNVYDTTLATLKSASTLYVDLLDTTARTVTLSGTVAGAANTDKLCFEGVSGASPAGPRGLYYWISYATSGTTAGVNRATENEIVSNSVNAAGGLTPEHGMALYHRILMRRGEVADGLLGLCNPAQQAVIWTNLMSIQNVDLAAGASNVTDRLPDLKGKKYFTWCNMPHYIDIHQDSKRLDYIAPKLWGRGKLDDGPKFFELPGSNQRFFHLTGASGGPLAGVWFALTCDEDIYCTDPGAQGVIYGLTLPASGFYGA